MPTTLTHTIKTAVSDLDSSGLVAVTTTSPTQTTPWGFTTQDQAAALITQVNASTTQLAAVVDILQRAGFMSNT